MAVSAYFAIPVRLLNRDLRTEAQGFEDYSEAELALTLRLVRSGLKVNEDPRAALLEMEIALVNQKSLDPAASAHRINGESMVRAR